MVIIKRRPQQEKIPINETTIKSEEVQLLESMTLQQKIGQLFLFGFTGTTLTEETKEMLERKEVGGVLLYGHNIINNNQVKKLNKDIKKWGSNGILVAIDQEGGVVSRLKGSIALTKSQREIRDEEEAREIAKERATLLKELGINTNFAPVVEYCTDSKAFMYNRVFNGDTDKVSKLGIASILGYQDAGIISTIKHYPGHSNTHIDSHKTLPTLSISDSEWEEYIYTFKDIVKRAEVDMIMTGHILLPKIDKYPSTLSHEIIGNRLRRNLGYKGVVISDDMLMKSIEEIDTHCNIAKQALLAGNDILIYSGNLEIQNEVYECILQSVITQEIEESIIDEKVLRVLKLKIKYNLIDTTPVEN